MLRFWKKNGTRPAAGAAGSRIHAEWRSDAGCHRDLNEDSAFAIVPEEEEVYRRKGALLVVADGMGGYRSGEVASRVAAETVRDRYYKGRGEPQECLRAAFQAAHEAIVARSSGDKNLNGMGTTCTALALLPGMAFVAHVGDSRLYLVRGGQIYLMTEDHSEVMRMVRRGELSLEQARCHEDRNLLYQAMGRTSPLEIFTWKQPFPAHIGDRFVLCSDGLHDLVDENRILGTVSGEPPDQACRRLIEFAREAGGFDNITVVIGLVCDGVARPALKETRQAEVMQ